MAQTITLRRTRRKERQPPRRRAEPRKRSWLWISRRPRFGGWSFFPLGIRTSAKTLRVFLLPFFDFHISQKIASQLLPFELEQESSCSRSPRTASGDVSSLECFLNEARAAS